MYLFIFLFYGLKAKNRSMYSESLIQTLQNPALRFLLFELLRTSPCISIWETRLFLLLLARGDGRKPYRLES